MNYADFNNFYVDSSLNAYIILTCTNKVTLEKVELCFLWLLYDAELSTSSTRCHTELISVKHMYVNEEIFIHAGLLTCIMMSLFCRHDMCDYGGGHWLSSSKSLLNNGCCHSSILIVRGWCDVHILAVKPYRIDVSCFWSQKTTSSAIRNPMLTVSKPQITSCW